MTRRALVLVTVMLMLAIGSGCGSTTHRATPTVKVVSPPAAIAPLQLAAFDDGIGAVAEGRTAPVWREPGAVAALDGSAVFSIRFRDGVDNLVRLDPATGTVASTWALTTDGLSISAVAPAGRWVALTDRTRGYGSQGRESTKLVVFDAKTGTVTHRTTLTGDIQPEAFSVDGRFVFVLHYVADHYRVQTLYLNGPSYELGDTIDRDKTLPAEDMHGRPLHGVLSADRTLLATLYRNPGDIEEPAFVHVLDLAHTWSYCADLPAPFGTSAPGSDAIELTAAGTVVVAATEAQRLAEIDIAAVSTPGDSPVPVAYRTGTIAPPPASLTTIPGFEYVIAPLPE